MGVIAEMAERVAVMYAGQIVEQTDVRTLFADPKHPYTKGLIGSIPVIGVVKGELDVIPAPCRIWSTCRRAAASLLAAASVLNII